MKREGRQKGERREERRDRGEIEGEGGGENLWRRERGRVGRFLEGEGREGDHKKG